MKRAWDEVEVTQARVEINAALPSYTVSHTCITAEMLTNMQDFAIAINYT